MEPELNMGAAMPRPSYQRSVPRLYNRSAVTAASRPLRARQRLRAGLTVTEGADQISARWGCFQLQALTRVEHVWMALRLILLSLLGLGYMLLHLSMIVRILGEPDPLANLIPVLLLPLVLGGLSLSLFEPGLSTGAELKALLRASWFRGQLILTGDNLTLSSIRGGRIRVVRAHRRRLGTIHVRKGPAGTRLVLCAGDDRIQVELPPGDVNQRRINVLLQRWLRGGIPYR